MSLDKLSYSKEWTNPTDFPTVETDEAQVRADQQLLYDEIKTFLNTKLIPALEALGVESTLESAMLMSMIKEALEGNVKAAYFVAQYAGQSGLSDADLEEQSARTSQIRANTERIRRNSNDYDEGDGVTIVNDAPEESEDIGYCDSEVSEDIQQQDD